MQSKQQFRSYKFHFIKDHFLIWAVASPLGLICWALPVVLFLGLRDTGDVSLAFFVSVILGVICYLLGIIFIYQLMEGIYTRVTFTDDHILRRLPWLFFPLIQVKKQLDLNQVQHIELYAHYGTRKAVFLYYKKNKREKKFYIPRFEHDPAYLHELAALDARFAPATEDEDLLMHATPTLNKQLSAEQVLPSEMPPASRTLQFLETFISKLLNLAIYIIPVVSGYISRTIPPGGFIPALTGAFLSLMLCLIGLWVGRFPLISQVLFWLYGRKIIVTSSKLLMGVSSDSINWDLPEFIQGILGGELYKTAFNTLTDFLFWSVFGFTILESIAVILGRLKQRIMKKSLNASKK